MNAFAAADYAVIPFEATECSLGGIRQVMDTIADVQNQWLNNNLRTIGFLVTRYEHHKVNCKKHLETFKKTEFASHLFKTMIRDNAELEKSVSAGVPITEYNKNCYGYWDYRDFTEELLERVATNYVY
jgi:chromosome partitioning protein